MPAYLWIIVLLFALVVIGALLIAAVAIRRSGSESDLTIQETRSQGYYVSIGISIGAGLGVALGLVFDNLALGIAIGVAIGASIGAALEQRNKDEVRSPGESGDQTQRRRLIISLLLGLLGLVVLAGLLLLVTR